MTDQLAAAVEGSGRDRGESPTKDESARGDDPTRRDGTDQGPRGDGAGQGGLAPRFVDRSGATSPAIEDGIWPPLVVPAQQIAAEVDRLCAIPRPPNGRRAAMVVHPLAEEPGLGLAPGIRVTLEVLLPGERTSPVRHNSAQVCFCIEGSGFSVVGGRKIAFERYDVWNTPALTTYFHENDTGARHVRLTYSNAPVLEKLHVHFVDEQPPEVSPLKQAPSQTALAQHPVSHLFQVGEQGPLLMSYERLINPEVVEQPVVHWPWAQVKGELDKLMSLGPAYRGRRLYLLYNPATGRTNGTTNSFFATMTVRPPGIVDRPHRHASAAINYFFSGSGWSRVAGRRYEWSAGDLMLTAPGWAIHNHASNDAPVYELTIQDSPMHIALDSLMWQEDLKLPPRLLGSQRGFDTNRETVE
ncbi:MAG TPA: AraC family ligand binding domain-containing protein [Acidimicrobiales bacterium]|nr:AraC family ligand binding domain-containing protein [Acidimicrobiales bacterium]